MRMFAVLMLLACPLVAQGFSLPFALTGGPLHIDGTFTSGPPVVCAGTVSIGGTSSGFGPCKEDHHGGGVYWYKVKVTIEEDDYIIWISVDTQAQVGKQIGGYWYIAGNGPGTTPLQ